MNFLIQNARWLMATALLYFCSCFGQTFFISLFAGEIRSAFSLTHGDWGLIYSGGTLTSAIAMLCFGGLVDRYKITLNIKIVVVQIKGKQVRLGIKAPKETKIHREEVYQAIQDQNTEASQADLSKFVARVESRLPKIEPQSLHQESILIKI